MYTLIAILRWMLKHPLTWIAFTIALITLGLTENIFIGVLLLVAGEAGVFAHILNSPKQLRSAFYERSLRERKTRAQRYDLIMEPMLPEVRARIRQVFRYRDQLIEQLNSPHIENGLNSFMHGLESQVNDLTDRSVRLAERQNLIQTYLNQTEKHEIEHIITSLEKQISHSVNEEVEPLQSALELRKRELQHIDDMQQATKQIDTQWMQIEAVLSELKARIVRLQTAEEQERAMAQQTVNEDIRGLTHQLEALENTVREILTI